MTSADLQSRGLQEEEEEEVEVVEGKREVLTLPLLARESPQSAGSVRLLDFFSSMSPASSMMGSSLVCTHTLSGNAGHAHTVAE